VVRVNAASHPG